MSRSSKLSIIIPSYNRLNYLIQCIKSVKAQKGVDYELIVIDDASIEDFEPIKNLCDKYIRNNINLGPSYSRNLGVLNSKGDILLFLDSDIKLQKDSLKKLIKIFKQNDSIGAIGSSGPPDETQKDVKFIISKFYNRFGQSKKKYYYTKDYNLNDTIHDCDHVESAFFGVRRKVFEEVGGFDPYWFYLGEDRDICLSIRKLGYRVVVSTDIKAIHFSLHSYESNKEKNISHFLLTKYLQVAIKRDGVFGGVLWMIGNIKTIYSKGVSLFSLIKIFKDSNKLIRRRGINFLYKSEMNKYYLVKMAEMLNKNLPFRISYPLLIPQNIVLFLTLKCNISCEHCFIPKQELNFGEDIKLQDIMRIIKSLNRPASISLTGGEPFLRKDILEILDKLMQSKYIRSVRISSNGILSSRIEYVCKKICDKYRKPLDLQFSLDGLADTHNKIRNAPKGFEKVIDTCERSRELQSHYPNFSFKIAITIMRQNIDEIESLVDFLEEKRYYSKLSFVRGNLFSTFDVPLDILDNEYGPKEDHSLILKKRVEGLLKRITYKHPLYFNAFQKQKLKIMLNTLIFKKRQIPCYAGYKDVVVFSDGHIAICEQVKPFGHLSKWNWDLSKAWNSKEAWEQRSKLTKCSCIHGCNISTSISMQK